MAESREPVPEDRAAAAAAAASVHTFERRLRDRGGRARVTPVLVGLNVLAFVALVAANGGTLAFRPDVLAAWGANVGVLTANGEWWRLLTAAFLHLGVAHLVLNAWALWSVGRDAERFYGSATYAVIYCVAAVLASLGSAVWDPSRTSVGASGAIFGIGGALLAFLARHRTSVPAGIARTQWIATGVFVAVSLAAGVVIPGIDNAAHVSGLVAGFALGWWLARPLGDETRTRAVRAKLVAAVGVAALALLAGVAYLRAPDSRAEGLHAFWAAHPWYAAGESASLAAWERLARDAQSGRLPMAEFATAVERDVLPFWADAVEHLDAERRASPAASPFRERVLEFARLRRDLARAQIAAARGDGDLDATRPLAESAMLAQARIEYATMREAIAAQSRGLVARLPLDRLRAQLATRGRCLQPPPDAEPGLPGPLDSPRDAPALAMAAACESQRLFVEGRYRELDAALARHAARRNDLPDGSSTLTGAYAGFDYLFVEGRPDVRQVLRQVAAWRRQVPGSVLPELVESQALRAWARQAVDDDGRTTSTEFQARRLREEMANEALRSAKDAGADHPVWYTLSMLGAAGDPDGIVAGRALFEAGIERFPRYYPLYRSMLQLLQPRVLGSFEQVAAFIDEVTTRAPDGEREPLYARLYAEYAALEGDEADIYANVGADWPTIERGFRALLDRHPDSDFLLNTFANLACRRGDAAVYRSLREALEARRSAAAWRGDVQVETCDVRLLPGGGDLSAAEGPLPPVR
jgi:rhomboid protease GluP